MTEQSEQPDDREWAEEDSDIAHLKRHTAMLSEHFETVQIIVTRHRGDGEGTVMASWGGGNWYARYGSVREFLVKEDERIRENVRGECDD